MTTGYLTQSDLASLKLFIDSNNIDSTRIANLIKSDRESDFKVNMQKGVDYYAGQHEILKRKKGYWKKSKEDASVVFVEDVTKSNVKVSHPFVEILVDQKKSYVAGNPVSVSVKRPEVLDENNPTPSESASIANVEKFEKLLRPELGDRFNDMLGEVIKGAGKKGMECVHPYYTENSELRYVIIPAEQCIPVYDSEYQENLIAFARYYQYTFVDDAGGETDLWKFEYWGRDAVEYWAEIPGGKFIPDPDKEANPRPYFFAENTSTGEKNAKSWGRIPIAILWNNSEGTTDAQKVIPLVDVFDIISSDWADDEIDIQQVIHVLKGYSGDRTNLAEIITGLKENKVLTLGENGEYKPVTITVPYEGKKALLDTKRREIFYFGKGVDVDQDKFGNSPSGISLKFSYSLLDMKANDTIIRVKFFLNEFLWFVVDHINRINNTKFSVDDLVYTFNKSMIFNTVEMMQALSTDTVLDEQTKIENHPLVSDARMVMKRLEEQRAKADLSAYGTNLDNVQDPTDPNSDAAQ